MGKAALREYMKDRETLSVSKAAQETGVSLPTVYSFLQAEGMERLAKGVYARPAAWIDEMFMLSQRSKTIVFSHESALYLHNLADREPNALTVTVPSNYNAGNLTKTGIRVYYVKPDLIDLGRVECETPESNQVPCYDLERTICDCVRSRRQLEEQLFFGALKSYVRRNDKRLDTLASYAQQLGISGVVSRFLEVLL